MARDEGEGVLQITMIGIFQKTDASCCNFRLPSEKWIDPKFRPMFTEIMAALKLLQKPNNRFSSSQAKQIHMHWPSEGSGITNCRRSRLEEQTTPSYSLSLDCKNMGRSSRLPWTSLRK
ncbi:hypothetical protein I3843_16G088600 [Carya illinoinensis]|nr:hypothetical protein I3843_16G088600 [Carya illinoinensis]